jgi:hypothetical protein
VSQDNGFILRVLLYAYSRKESIYDLESESKSCNWEYFSIRVVDLSLAPLIFDYLKQHNFPKFIPERVVLVLEQAFYKVLSFNMLLQEKFRFISEELNKRNISFIPLKGIFLSDLYSNIGIRQTSDIDILFRKSDNRRVLKLFESLSFNVFYNVPRGVVKATNYPSPYKFTNGALLIDYHEELCYREHGYKLPIDDFWQRSVEKHGRSCEKRLSSDDLFLYQCLHIEKHIKVMECKLISFIDILLILDQFQLNFEIIRSRIESYRCAQEMSTVCFLMDEFFKTELLERLKLDLSDKRKYELKVTFEKILSQDRKSLYSENSVNGATGFSILKYLNFTEKCQYLFSRIFPDRDYLMGLQNSKGKGPLSLYFSYLRQMISHLSKNYFR